MTQQELRQISYETLSVIAGENYSVNGRIYNMRSMVLDMVDETVLYKPQDVIGYSIGFPMKPHYYLYNMSTIGAILKNQTLLNQRIGVLNFASAIKAGGGWLNGKVAQEEDIMRKTNAFVSLLSQDEFYLSHSISNPVYSDSIIYTKNASIIRDDDFNFIKPQTINLYTCAAVNLTEMKKLNPQYSSKEDMHHRIYRILSLMAQNHEETIVLGAFGCGVFGNNPTDIADIFFDVLVLKKLEDEFKNIIFAIYDNNPLQQNYNAFKKMLGI